MRVTVLTIAGSDSSCGAGLQADLRALAANGVDAATVVTAVTAQDAGGVRAVAAMPAEVVRAQLEAVFAGPRIAAAKTGMLATGDTVRAVARAIGDHATVPLVCDPVLASSTGFRLLDADGVDLLRRELLPLATLVTPNAHEAGELSGTTVRTLTDAAAAAEKILRMGARAVLVKGGHLEDERGVDLLVTAEGHRRFDGSWVASGSVHGTGCVYAAAIAAGLARGLRLEASIASAKRFVTEAIRAAAVAAGGIPSADPLYFLGAEQDRAPWAAGCGTAQPPGPLHVITDGTAPSRLGHAEIARLAARAGADVVQLREKRPLPARELTAIARGLRDAMVGTAARLIVNDRVDVAFAAGAAGVHLGRDDLDPAAARRALGAGAWIGATANTLEEALRADRAPVDYLGVGPVFGTRSKENPAPALGLEGLRVIVAAVSKPVVAIGGITPERVAAVLGTGAHGIAVLSAVLSDPDPEGAVRRLRRAIDDARAKGGAAA